MRLTDLIAEQLPEGMLWRWLVALGVAAAILLVIAVLRLVVLRRLKDLALRSHTFVDDALVAVAERTSIGLLSLPALYLALLIIGLIPSFLSWAYVAAIFAMLLQAGLWGSGVIRSWVERYSERNLETNAGAVGTAGVMSFVAQLALYSVLLLLALDNIPGVEVTALVASLGIGGIAVALAVQNILGDLFASLSIALDKPFLIGDFIIVDEMMGTVERIGLRTTRVRSLSGEQLIFSNTDLLNSRIRNFKRMQERRIVFSIGVGYETTAELLRRIPQILREAVEAQEQTRFDRAHFQGFGDFDLKFEVVYFVNSPDYNLYMDIQQAINLFIFERFSAEGVDFAYPTQKLYVEGAGARGEQPVT